MLRSLVMVLLLCGVVSAADMGTLKDYKSALNQAINNSTVPDSEMVIYINAGVQQVADDLHCFQKKDTVITSSGNSDYALNTDCLLNGVEHVELKKDGARYGIDKVPKHEIGNLAQQGGCPQLYYVWGQVLTVYPEGTAQACTLIVAYAAEPTYLTADADATTDIPMTYRSIVIIYAAYKYYDAVNRDQDATQQLTAYQAAILRKRAIMQPQPTVTGEP
jgi:hypothetical protein